MITTEQQKKSMNLIHAGLVPDTIVHLEDMEGKPYMIREYNGIDLLHETEVIKFEPLTVADKQKDLEEITRSFEGERLTHNLHNQVYSSQEISAAQIQLENKIQFPSNCDSDSDFCLEVSS